MAFDYPDENGPSVLLLKGPASQGIGPGKDIIAYSNLLYPQGMSAEFPDRASNAGMSVSLSSFDPAKEGRLVIGQEPIVT